MSGISRSGSRRSWGVGLFTVLVSAAALLPGTGALAKSHAKPHSQFSGACQLQGTATITDATSGAYRFVGDGTCVGQLNGKPVAGAPLGVTYEGTVTTLGGLVPLTGSGKGVVTIADPAAKRRYRFRFTAQQVGTVTSATCRGGGNAVAALVPTDPPSPNATTIHLAGVLTTLTPCSS